MLYPALDVHGADADLVLALVDDFAPTAVEEAANGISIFFSSTAKRDEALAAVALALADATLASREVDDEDWAKRSQQNLTPITVGRITVTPPWFADASHAQAADLTVTILPSMGFGTGHHATTRLCLGALQALEVRGRRVLDVGTGSGVLAIAAAALGASEAVGIDFDPDAITNARENLELNPSISGVRFETVDVRDVEHPTADIVLANLTGAVLVQNAARLRAAVAPGGTLVVSGLQTHELLDVLAAFGATARRQDEELDWMALTFNF